MSRQLKAEKSNQIRTTIKELCILTFTGKPFFVSAVILKFYLMFSGEGRYYKLVCSNINVHLILEHNSFN